jgi:multiple sugar transport system substrate-binding protein
MEELELSVMRLDVDPVEGLRPLLDQFEAEHKCHVRVSALSWVTGWTDLVKTALYGSGADVSEIGTTWCASFVSMNALRPFAPHEVASLGGASTFLPTSWQTGMLPGGKEVWAVPWSADMRLIYYRRDLLEQAGVDEHTAFASHQQLLLTLERLQASGVAIPWIMPTTSYATLHSLAAWIWAAGGDLITADGKHTLLNQPETRAGLRAYFELGRYLSPAVRNLDLDRAQDLFWQGQAAVVLSWPRRQLRNLQELANPQVAANLGVALTPNVTWIGGTDLVVWQHVSRFSRAREALVLDLVRFLTSQKFQGTYGQQANYLPVRHDVLDAPPFGTDPVYRTLTQGLRTGRTFPTIAAWGLFEDRILPTLEQIWKDLLTDSPHDLDAIIAKHIDPLAQRLDMALAQMR